MDGYGTGPPSGDISGADDADARTGTTSVRRSSISTGSREVPGCWRDCSRRAVGCTRGGPYGRVGGARVG